MKLEPEMADSADEPWSSGPPMSAKTDEARPLPIYAKYAAGLLLVAAATLLAFIANRLGVVAPALTLIFVLPVVVAATVLGWGPAILAIGASLLAFDFFFTRPYFTLQMTDPSEIWAAGLLFVTATIVSAVAGESRRRALAAQRAANQAEALRSLAHIIVEGRTEREVVWAAARALSGILEAPAVIFAETDGEVRTVATAGETTVTEAETDAARGALQAGSHIRAETYPFDLSKLDLWPVSGPEGRRYVLGVDLTRSELDRPGDADRFAEIVGAYLVAHPEPAARRR
jgi:two-component system sensor histidine kinase KdpD